MWTPATGMILSGRRSALGARLAVTRRKTGALFCAPLSNLLRFVPLEAAIEVPRAAEVDAGPGPASAAPRVEVVKEVGVAARLLVRLRKGVPSGQNGG